MRVPLQWLQQYVDVRATAEEVGTRLTMGGLEVEAIETDPKEFPLVPVLDVYVTPNRGDCLSMVGVAREVAALYGLPLSLPAIPEVTPGVSSERITLKDPDLCPRYAARLVRNVRIGPSPQWMQDRLLSAGMRPINQIVDVTNYVMLELGQPLHAFDLDHLEGKRIVVRRARPGETLITLDGVERTLTPEMLVIADAVNAVGVAGVMGGASSEVTETTVNVLIESAHFNPLSVRRTSRELALRTEASYRFERMVDPEGVLRAVNRACQLLAEMGAGEPEAKVLDVYPQPIPTRHLTLRPKRATELLGMEITPESAAECLQRLDFGVTAHGNGATLDVTVPSFRADVTLEEDLVEEVGRIYGYENIPETLPAGGTTTGGDSAEGRLILQIKQLLAACGMQEVVTHSLTAPSFFDAPDDDARGVPVRNALSSEVSRLRRSLIPTLLDVAQTNAARGQNGLALFEIGRVWQQEETVEGIEPREYVAIAGLLVGPNTAGDWQRGGRAIQSVADYPLARGMMERLLKGLQIHDAEFLPPSALVGALETITTLGVGDDSLPPGGANHVENPSTRHSQISLGHPTDALIPQYHPGRTAFIRLTPNYPADGVVGEIHPRLAANLPFRERVYVFEIGLEALRAAIPVEGPRFRELNPYPAVTRDLAPRVALELPYREVQQAIRALDLPLLEEFRLTDVFTGSPLPEGSKSLTLAFTFRSPVGTLKENEVNAAIGQIRAALTERCRATFTA